MPNNFAAESFHTEKLCSRLSSTKTHFLYGKWKKIAFEAPWGLGATYDVHLRLIGKLVGAFLLVIIELFFARYFRFVTRHAFDRQTDGRTESRHEYRAYASQSHGKKVSVLSPTWTSQTSNGFRPAYLSRRAGWVYVVLPRWHLLLF